jgi:hypothetical protein
MRIWMKRSFNFDVTAAEQSLIFSSPSPGLLVDNCTLLDSPLFEETCKIYNLEMSKNGDQMDEFKLTFPFTDFSKSDQRFWADNVECALFANSLREKPVIYIDELLHVFTMIEGILQLNLKSLFFVDCMSHEGASCLFAFSYRFGKVLGLELSKGSCSVANDTLSILAEQFPSHAQDCNVSFRVGSYMEYLPFDADLVFLDARQFIDQTGLMDESMLIATLLDMSRNLLPSSMILILSSIIIVDREFCDMVHAHHVIEVYQRRRNKDTDYHLWLLQTRRTHTLAEVAIAAMSRK